MEKPSYRPTKGLIGGGWDNDGSFVFPPLHFFQQLNCFQSTSNKRLEVALTMQEENGVKSATCSLLFVNYSEKKWMDKMHSEINVGTG